MKLRRLATFGLSAVILLSVVAGGTLLLQSHNQALASACVTPTTDYGQVSNLSVNITTAGTYRIWSRMAAPDTSDNTYMLEVDGSSCFTVGGSSVPVYASGATTHFANNSSNWIHLTSSGADVSLNLSAGSHTLRLIGNAPGVVLDRLIITSDTTCTPTGTGDNCITPADTTPPTITGIAATGITSNSATINWTTNEVSDTQVAYGTSTSYGTSTILVSTLVTNHTASLSGLSPSTTYHYQVRSKDASGNQATGSDATFTTPAAPDTTPPTISAIASSNLTSTTATITWTTNEASDTQVAYGTSTSYGSTSTLASSLVTTHSVSLSGLSPSTTYHFQVRSKDAAGNQATGADTTFTTPAAPDTTAPTITAIASSNLTTTGATISWTTNEAANTQVSYGTTTSYGYTSPLVSTLATSHSVSLTGLLPSTTYHFQVRSADASGNLAKGGDATFTTPAIPDTTPPTISGITSSNITTTGATITWATNEAADTQVAYGTTTSYGSISTLVSTKATTHSVSLTGLSPSTTYHYQVRSADASGNLAKGVDSTFTTTATVTYKSGDVNEDGHVNILDVSAVVSKWGQTTNLGRADINGDGKISILDISAVVSQYGQ